MNRFFSWVVSVFIACVFSCTSVSAEVAPPPILVCYLSGPIQEEDANTTLSAMLRAVERLGQWKPNSLEHFFSSQSDACQKKMDEKKPGFVITSLGLFLEKRAAHHFIPLVQPKIRGNTYEQYHIVARKDRFTSLASLKGKTLGGAVIEESQFINRVVFSNTIDSITYFQLRPTRQILRALRALDKGELDAVMLNGQQSAALSALPLQHPVHVVFTSSSLPLMGVAASEDRTTSEDRARFTQAMVSLCGDPEGSALCRVFGVENFVASDNNAYTSVIHLWDKQ